MPNQEFKIDQENKKSLQNMIKNMKNTMSHRNYKMSNK